MPIESQQFFESSVEWSGAREGSITGAGLAPVTVGAPPEFGGRTGCWTPEHLLVASVNTCFMLTLIAVAENSKVELLSLASTATGKLEKISGAGYQITEIVLKPIVVLAKAESLQRIPRILNKAKENCFITNSIKGVVKLEPQVFHRQTQASPCPLGRVPSIDDQIPD